MEIWPRDIIAIICAIGSFALIYCGIDGVVGSVLIAIVAFYFGADILKQRNEEE